MTKYTYTKTVRSDQLEDEIKASSITIAEHHIDTSGPDIDIWFQTDLSVGEITILDALVAAHIPVPYVAPTQDVNIISGIKKDPYTDKLITSDQRFNGPLYVPSCNFQTGYGSGHASWKPPKSNSTNGFWTIDVSTPGITKVTFAPSYNYQADGLGYHVHGAVTNPAYIQEVVLNPHIPAIYGGSYVFAEGKKLTDNGAFERYTDPKYIPKQATIPGVGTVATNVLQFVIEHDPSEHISMEVMASVYPQ
jgi:hypothetical protein